MHKAGILATTALSLLCVYSPARADTARALTAAKAGLPADTKLVIGIDIATVQKTQLFQTYFPMLRGKPEIAEAFETIEQGCKLDPLEVIRDVVVGMASDRESGAMYLALAGVDRAKLSACFLRVSQAKHKDMKVEVKQSGNITELVKGTDHAFFGWVAKDVIAISFHGDDKAALVKWTGGKGSFAKSALGKTLGKVNTQAAIWAAGEGTKEVDAGVTVKGGYGAVTVLNDNLAADVHAVTESAKQAIAGAKLASDQLDAAKRGAPGVPPELVVVLKTVTVAADKDEVRIQANMVEKDLLTLIAALAKSGAL